MPTTKKYNVGPNAPRSKMFGNVDVSQAGSKKYGIGTSQGRMYPSDVSRTFDTGKEQAAQIKKARTTKKDPWDK